MAENTATEKKTATATESKTEKKQVDGMDVAEINVTLANGADVSLDVILDRDNWAYETLQAQAEGNTAALVNGVLTGPSATKLRFAGARVKDFRTIAEAVGEALDFLDEE